jgi:SAM-dependent methyltransferase
MLTDRSTTKYRSNPSSHGIRIAPGDVSPGSTFITRRTAAFYQRTLHSLPPGTLLDAGCGDSSLTAVLPAHIHRVIRVDWPGSLHDATSVDAFADLDRGVPLRDHSVTNVVLADVLEHVSQPQSVLNDLQRVMQRRGTLVGNVPFCYWLHEEPHDYFRYTEHGLRMMLDRAGFVETSIEVLAGGADVIIDLVGKGLSRVPYLGAPAARCLQQCWSTIQ